MRLRTRWHLATEPQALGALLGVWRMYGTETFGLNLRGPTAGALLLARHLGWIWTNGTGCNVTLAGVLALSDHLGRDLLDEWIDAERAAAAEPPRWASDQAELDRWPEAAE